MEKNLRGKIIVLSIPILLLISVLAACGDDSNSNDASGQSDSITVTLGHAGSPTHQYHYAVEKMVEIIEERSDGEITFDVHHSGQLGSEGDVIEGLQYGTVDMTVVSADSDLGQIIPEMQVIGVPYLFRDYEHVYEVLDGEIGKEILAYAEEHDIKGLGFWESGFGQLSNSVREIKEPEDMEGLQMRTMPAPIWTEFMNRVGASSQPMDYNELYSALEQGVVDGQENPINTIASASFDEVQDYITILNATYKAGPVLISNELWDTLDEEQKNLFEEAVHEAALYQREFLQELEAENIEKFEAEGITITEANFDAFRDAVEGIEETLPDQIPNELIERIRAE